MNVEHIGLCAEDSEALAAWYANVLGLREIKRIGKDGRAPVVFLQGEHGAVVEILPTDVAQVEHALKVPGFTHLGFPVSDIDAEITRLTAMGVKVWGVRSTSNGWTIAYFNDPEGNILEIIQH